MAADTSKENTPNSSSTDDRAAQNSQAGDPNCPICGGLGYLRQDLPVGHPDFGKVVVCTCRRAEVSRLVHQRLFLMSNLESLQRLTFDTFQPRGRVGLGEQQASSIERAFNQAQQFADTLNGWLLLMGDYGSGKTHLAAAIANRAVELGVETLFLTVPDLLDWLRFSYGSTEISYEQRFEEIRKTSLLILDDFGTQNATAWAQEKLFQILNFRYINQLATAITTNQSLEEIEPRLRSRMQDPELVTVCKINAPDFRNPADDTGHHELSSLGMHAKQSFSNFNLRRDESLKPEEMQSLERAFQAAQQFAEHPSGWLVLMGTYGCGKTHLAAAIGNYRASLGYPPLLVVVPDLLDHLRATFSPNSNTSYDKRFYEVRSTPFLILDDLSTQSATPWAKEKLYQILNYRYNAELPTVITTADTFENLDERLRTRMLDASVCRAYAITAPFFRGADRNPADKKSHPVRRRTP
jgi:DNA replication protein DnaC